jgi:hypothetical protein
MVLSLQTNPNLLAHELGHIVGWLDNGPGMNGDRHHSGQLNNLMGYLKTSIDSVFADQQWCEKMCRCARDKN